ncbi:MAG: hypothetical protein LBQ67_01565 [Treponema sp.]|jgi:hypothetical protein|nr:hypothetical protein [Treponema sp.]
MTLSERFAIAGKALEYEKAGNEAEYERIMKEELPMLPYLAKWAKDHLGADFLINGRWNLSEAEAEFGQNWLTD